MCAEGGGDVVVFRLVSLAGALCWCAFVCQVEPFFALPWILTWFAHDINSLDSAARLFDLFLASHPLMPLYLSVAVRAASVTADPCRWTAPPRGLHVTGVPLHPCSDHDMEARVCARMLARLVGATRPPAACAGQSTH